MNMKPQKSDFQFAARRLTFHSPEVLPLVFHLDGMEYRGLPEEFHPESRRNSAPRGLSAADAEYAFVVRFLLRGVLRH